MQIKRWIVVVASLLIGAVVTGVIIYGPPPIGFATTVQKFAYSNVVLLFLSVACIAGIWLDYALDTKILKS